MNKIIGYLNDIPITNTPLLEILGQTSEQNAIPMVTALSLAMKGVLPFADDLFCYQGEVDTFKEAQQILVSLYLDENSIFRRGLIDSVFKKMSELKSKIMAQPSKGGPLFAEYLSCNDKLGLLTSTSSPSDYILLPERPVLSESITPDDWFNLNQMEIQAQKKVDSLTPIINSGKAKQLLLAFLSQH